MHNDTPVLTTLSPGGSNGGFSFSRVTPNVAYHVDWSTGTKTKLMQETLTGTNPVVISNRVEIFDFNRCPGLPGVNAGASATGQGGFSALSVSSDDRFYGTGLNFPPSISGQGGAHWVVVWDRTAQQCATWYTGEVQNAENPDNGNIWGWCDVSGTHDCSHSGSYALPMALNTQCAQPGFGIHGVQMAHNGQYINASGMCNSTVTTNSSTKWHIGFNEVRTCRGVTVPGDDDYYNCGGHGTAGYSTMYYSNQTVTVRPMSDISAWTTIHNNLNLNFHGSAQWVGAAADTNPWLVSTLEDVPGVSCTDQPWCFELIAIRHDGIISRFAPNYHVLINSNDLGPISVMTPDGYCMIFSSTWNNTLGTDADEKPRKDIFSICNLQ
jgi:hypothetical protein